MSDVAAYVRELPDEKLLEHRRHVCERKLRHNTVQVARTAARKARRRQGDGPIREYQCAFCGFWHIGHKASDTRRRAFLDALDQAMAAELVRRQEVSA